MKVSTLKKILEIAEEGSQFTPEEVSEIREAFIEADFNAMEARGESIPISSDRARPKKPGETEGK